MAGKFTTENAGAYESVPRRKTKFEPDPSLAVPGYDDPVPDAAVDINRNDPVQFVMDILRNFNDTITLGAYPKVLEATGADPLAEERLDASSDFSRLLGQGGAYATGTGGIGMGLAKAIPWLGRYTVPSVTAREGLAATTMSTAENLAAGDLNPNDVGWDAAISSLAGPLAGLVSGTNRVFNPGARVRAAGADVTAAEREATEGMMRYADSEGVPLTVPEALSAVDPTKSQRVESLFEGSARAPDASGILASFNAGRRPKLAEAGRRIASDIRGNAAPLQPREAADTAKEAIGNVRGGFTLASRPFFEAAEQKKLPPSWVPKTGFAREAYERVKADTALLDNLGNPPINSVKFLDAVRSELDIMAKSAFNRGDGKRGGFILDELDALTQKIDQMVPSYASAREIAEQGADAIGALEAGPLGSIAANRTGTAQESAIFNAANSAEKEAVDEALRHIPEETPLGMLANRVEREANKKPIGWGRSALPTDASAEIADEVLARGGRDAISPKLKVARAVKPRDIEPIPNEHTGPIGEGWSILRDFGKKGVVKRMLKPETARTLGVQGPLEHLVTRGTTGATLTAGDNEKRRRRRNRQR